MHTVYYDSTLLILPVLLIIDYMLDQGHPLSNVQRVILIAAHAGSRVALSAKLIHFQPLVILPLWVCWWANRLIRKTARPHAGTHASAEK